MSAYYYSDGRADDVTVSDLTVDLGMVVLRIGRGSVHLDPDTARKVATDILAIVDKPVTP